MVVIKIRYDGDNSPFIPGWNTAHNLHSESKLAELEVLSYAVNVSEWRMSLPFYKSTFCDLFNMGRHFGITGTR
jgi:hypothetical protein